MNFFVTQMLLRQWSVTRLLTGVTFFKPNLILNILRFEMPSKILFIDDHELVREIVCEMLVIHGFEVLSAPDGLTGIQLAREFLPDLIISDYYMPGATGLEVLSAVRSDERTSSIPFALISMDDSIGLRKRSQEAGVDAFLSKGFGDSELVETVRNLLSKNAA